MTDRITAGAAAVIACLVGASFLSRWAVTAARTVGRHRGPARPYGAIVARAFGWCPGCRSQQPVVLRPDAPNSCETCQAHIPGGAP